MTVISEGEWAENVEVDVDEGGAYLTISGDFEATCLEYVTDTAYGIRFRVDPHILTILAKQIERKLAP